MLWLSTLYTLTIRCAKGDTAVDADLQQCGTMQMTRLVELKFVVVRSTIEAVIVGVKQTGFRQNCVFLSNAKRYCSKHLANNFGCSRKVMSGRAFHRVLPDLTVQCRLLTDPIIMEIHERLILLYLTGSVRPSSGRERKRK